VVVLRITFGLYHMCSAALKILRRSLSFVLFFVCTNRFMGLQIQKSKWVTSGNLPGQTCSKVSKDYNNFFLLCPSFKYKIIKLQRFGSWILLPSSDKTWEILWKGGVLIYLAHNKVTEINLCIPKRLLTSQEYLCCIELINLWGSFENVEFVCEVHSNDNARCKSLPTVFGKRSLLPNYTAKAWDPVYVIH
jgi:hypothetical protein